MEKISRMTKVKNLMSVKNYLSHLKNSFLFYSVAKFSYSLKDQIYNPDKIYVIDSGMYNEIAFLSSPNFGRILENIVFLELKRRGKDVYYYREKNECDFVIRENNSINTVIQVTKNLNLQNENREIMGLVEAMNKFELKEGLILTEDQEEERKIKGKSIKLVPLWKWLIEEK